MAVGVGDAIHHTVHVDSQGDPVVSTYQLIVDGGNGTRLQIDVVDDTVA